MACLAELADAAPSAVSQHLAKLRLAGLVRGRREGTFVYYSAADEHVRRLTLIRTAISSRSMSEVRMAMQTSVGSNPGMSGAGAKASNPDGTSM